MSPHLSNFTRLGPPAGGRNGCEARVGISKVTMRDADPPVPIVVPAFSGVDLWIPAVKNRDQNLS